MDRADIIRMAREAGASFETAESMFRFADLVAAAEREACVNVCEAYWDDLDLLGEDDYQTGRGRAAIDLRASISARNTP